MGEIIHLYFMPLGLGGLKDMLNKEIVSDLKILELQNDQ